MLYMLLCFVIGYLWVVFLDEEEDGEELCTLEFWEELFERKWSRALSSFLVVPGSCVVCIETRSKSGYDGLVDFVVFLLRWVPPEDYMVDQIWLPCCW